MTHCIPWGRTEISRLRKLAGQKLKPREIAARMGISVNRVRKKLQWLRHGEAWEPTRSCLSPRAEAVRQRGRRSRSCLRCRDPFMSIGAENRLCPRCNDYAESQSPLALY